ncbi:MAG TPA: hypothetical protein PKW98_14695, partial [Candidatus Wallbacteria bacterium]|nr:hypothetical protein [Candidatus Wallbacteria bacterium]
MLKRALLIIAVLLIFSSQVSAQTESQSLILKPGFNFISFTVTISITPQQLKQFSSYVEDVYLYSAAAGSFLSVNEGTLTTIAAGKGYIIKSASAETLTLTIPGSLLANVNNITLKPGFNLVGFSKVP